jgi:hypothetical protein
MDKNILYQNLDMLSVMEACEDKSKDFILLFMPTNLGGTVGESALRPSIDKVKAREIIRDIESKKLKESELGRIYNLDCSTIKEYVNTYADSREWDYGGILFFDENDYDAYMALIKKVIQNAGRILKENGTLCFGIPRLLRCVGKTLKYSPDFQMLLNQAFQNVGMMLVRNYSIDENPDKQPLSFYTLYACTNGPHILPEENIGSRIALPHERELYRKLFDDDEYKINSLISKLTNERYYVDRYMKYKSIFYPELRYGTVEEMAERCSLCKATDEQREVMRINFELQIREMTSPYYLLPLAKSLMLTYCKAKDGALFPYDRNGQFAYFADSLNIYWESLYKKSITIDGGWGEDYLSKIDTRQYEVRTDVHNNKTVYYKSNMVATIEDAKLISDQLTKYTDLMSQVIQCASDNGWDNSGDMEDAVHALISLAVKSHAGSIVGDEAEKWFGEGWGQLSEQCKNYLQTAAAYDKISQQNGNADCAPIGIEYYRSLEYELNRTIVNNLFAYIKENRERVKIILENAEPSNDTKRITSLMSSILNDETVRGLTLGEIHQSLKAAAASSDEDVGSVIAECCRNKGYVNFLAYDNVSLLGMAAQLRNLCAHPSDIDDSFMSLNLQIVRKALKEQQMRAESQRSSDAPSVCAIIGPDNNKMKYPEDDTNMKAAIKSLIMMLYKSGIRQYASTGNSGFDLLVADILKECRQSGEAKSIKIVEYLPCERDKMKFAPNRKKQVLAIDKFATLEVCGNADNAANKGICQEKALENVAFCIAFYAEDGQSAIANRVKDAMQKGTIVYNTYGIV